MLENDYFVFTGKQAQAIISGLEGHNQSSVTKKTTRLVTGYFPIDLIKGYSPSRKLTEAEQVIESGQPLISVLFFQLNNIRFLSSKFSRSIYICNSLLKREMTAFS